MFVKRSLNAVQINKYNAPLSLNKPCHYECVFIEINVDNCIYVIGGYYRHPNTPIKDFTDDFLYTLDKLRNVKRCYVFGDMNICLANYSKHAFTSAYIDAVFDSKFLPYVFMPTRFTNHSSSIIDHVYSNDLFIGNNVCKSGLIINDIADHCANFMFLINNNQKNSKNNISTESFRNFSKKNIDKFNNCLDSADWRDIFCCSEPNTALHLFIDKVSLIHDVCFPFIKPSKINDSDKKWVSPALVKSINKKCKLYKKWIGSKKICDEIKYKNYAKLLRNLLNVAEKQYYNKLFDSKSQSSKNIWKNINLLVNNKASKKSDINSIIDNGTTINHPIDIANSFNNYFCDVGDKLNRNASSSCNTSGNFSYKNFLKSPLSNSFYCSNITLAELIITVKKLKPSRSCVGNCISSTLLRDCIDHIALPLLHICNLSFDKGIFPSQLKISRVIPVFKKGSKLTMSNYRPISLTNPLGKVLEKLMHSRMVNYLEKFKILYDYQFGFRKNYSTSFAVIDVVNMIQNELFEDKFVLGVFMDLQKAFDTINFDILLNKLEHYGFRGICLGWFKSYLIERSQITEVNGMKSDIKITNCGIPQGTVLGPLLFLLYINDITNSTTKSKIKLFADDSNLFVIGDDLATLFDIANSELSDLSHWISINKLHINYDKTNYMLFYPSKSTSYVNDLVSRKHLLFNNHVIMRVHSVKYLGVMIDEKLSWSSHIDYLIGKVTSLTGILYRNKHFLPLDSKRNIYFALIYSVLTYCIEVYANIPKSSLNPLIIKCNRLLRLLQHKARRTPLYDLYSTFHTLPIDLLFQYFTAKFIHRCLYDSSNIPSVISNWFSRGTSLHTHNTRHRDNFYIQSKFNPKSISFYGPVLWAKLPVELQTNTSLRSFMKIYKEYLLSSMN